LYPILLLYAEANVSLFAVDAQGCQLFILKVHVYLLFLSFWAIRPAGDKWLLAVNREYDSSTELE